MSGTCIESFGKFSSKIEAWEMAQNIKIYNNAKQFSDLRNMDLSVIIQNFITGSNGQNLLPSIDGYVFPVSTLELVKSGYTNGESTMIGTLFRDSFVDKPYYSFHGVNSITNLEELNEYYNDNFSILK
eukprot:TRINITY_DN520_c0_g1_i1.p1 TRINITY_DN520_c0_g1~~TRINITY_DN520_c0_g1_i1.p1  ORF type:complete len:128 (-),score=10.55 TRINITY_DN520_c0_g1_i1:35-418(-)